MTKLITSSSGNEEDPFTTQEFMLAKKVADTLFRHYPGHSWMVNVEAEMVNIYSANLTTRYGYSIPADSITAEGREVIKAGGEILERYRLSRGKFNIDEWRGLKRDFKGDIVGDLSS